MSITDPIADMLTKIRNALHAKHRRVDVPGSGIKREIARILLEEKFIRDYAFFEDGKQGILRIHLRYGPREKSVIEGIKRASTPGRRRYVNRDRIPRVFSGLGVTILSTSRGVMTDRMARRVGVGGEVLCYVW
jgi:small subunit ribosomal protein S8